MSNYAKMYWLTRLDNLNTIFVLFLIAGVIMLFIVIMPWLILESKELEKSKRKLYKLKIVGIIFIIVGIIGTSFCPTKKDAIEIIAGGKVIDFVQQDTSLNQIPAQSTKIITNYLNNIIKDIDEKK
jgi:hypothetical protein